MAKPLKIEELKMSSIPPINYEAQEAFIEITDDQEHTPLRWSLYSLEKLLFIDGLPIADKEITSNPEIQCSLCSKPFKMPLKGFEIEKEERSAMDCWQRPLRLKCGHIVGRTCLNRLLSFKVAKKSNCRLCQQEIVPSTVPSIALIPKDGEIPDPIALLCFAIRCYLIFGQGISPETPRGLKNWIHIQLNLFKDWVYINKTGDKINESYLFYINNMIETSLWNGDIARMEYSRLKGDYLLD